MFQRTRDTEGAGGATAVAVALAWLARSWVPRVVAVAVAVALVGAGLYANALYRSALDDECAPLPPVDLSMAELIDLRKRVSAYQVDPLPSATLTLSGAEVGVLYGEGDGLQMRVVLDGDRARVDLAVPGEEGCWNVRFVGGVEVRQGVARVVPDALQVGGADLGWLVRGRSFTIRADSVPDDRLGHTLNNTSALDVAEGRIRVRLSDRWNLW